MTPDPWDIIEHHLHHYLGIPIGILMDARLAVRFRWPPLPDGRAASAAKALSRTMHRAFYAAIIGQAIMRFAASYFWFGIAPYHVIRSRIILTMVALHLAAAWHTLALRDDTIERMVLPRTRQSGDSP